MRMIRRLLAALSSAGFLVAGALGSPWGLPGPSFWILDLVLAAGLLCYVVFPKRVATFVPVEATFDWAGARFQEIPAPPGARFQYPLRLVMIVLLTIVLVERGFYAALAILAPMPTFEPPLIGSIALPATGLAGALTIRALRIGFRERKRSA